jgi:hypothetical protein
VQPALVRRPLGRQSLEALGVCPGVWELVRLGLWVLSGPWRSLGPHGTPQAVKTVCMTLWQSGTVTCVKTPCVVWVGL